jgi:FkbM family methyltransferase
MNQQEEHVDYTRKEWTTCKVFIDIINYLKTKKIEYVVDVGANVGEVSKIFLEEFSSIKEIYAYEPESVNFNFMETRFINEKKIKLIKKGIYYGESSGILFGAWRCGSHTLLGNPSMKHLETIPLSTLEKEKLNNIDLIKLDVEGAEYNIIENSELLKSIKYIIIEFHSFGMNDDNFNQHLPQTHQEKLQYQKNFTDNFIKKYLPNHKFIIDVEEQYLLEHI